MCIFGTISLTFKREYWAIKPKGPVRYSSQTMALKKQQKKTYIKGQ